MTSRSLRYLAEYMLQNNLQESVLSCTNCYHHSLHVSAHMSVREFKRIRAWHMKLIGPTSAVAEELLPEFERSWIGHLNANIEPRNSLHRRNQDLKMACRHRQD